MTRLFKLQAFLIVLLISVSFSAERCFMTFSACPQTFDHDTIVVPDKVVGISPSVLACKDTAYIESTSASAQNAFFFIIDNSRSMSGSGQTRPSDPTGARFTATKSLLDTIFKKQPNAQVGVAVFQEVLYFDTSTTRRFWYSTYFKTMSRVYDNLPQQAYLPLLTLNQTYGNGLRGIDIIDSVLATTGTGNNVTLRYTPNFATQGSTNINISFLAAREAFAASTIPRDNQYIIFLSDGAANMGASDPGQDSVFYFRDSVHNVPATFTVFFTPSGTTVPGSIDTMTQNIRKNGYSRSDTNSAYYTLEASDSALVNVLMNNVINQIGVPASPVRMVINSDTSRAFTNGTFVFADSFMFGNNVTQYSMLTTYQYVKPGTTVPILMTDTTIFYVRHTATATQPPNVSFNCNTLPTIDIRTIATFFDTDRDGHIDRIDITWGDTDKIRSIMPTVIQWIQTLNLTNWDGTLVTLKAGSITPDLTHNTIHINLTQNSGSTYETGWQTATVTFSDTAMSLSGRPFVVVSIVDSAAPVIKSACFVPGVSKDSLRVNFSEPVSIPPKPTSNINAFSDTTSNGLKNSFVIAKSSTDSTSIGITADTVVRSGDRRWLYYVYPPKTLTDVQAIKENARPSMSLGLCGDVSIITTYHVASNPFKPRSTPIPPKQVDPNNPTVTTGTRIEVSLIPAIKQELIDGMVKGKITIFDAVGNLIYATDTMSIDIDDTKNTTKLFKTWSGITKTGKYASGGTYLARIEIQDLIHNRTQTIRQSIGIQQAK